MATSTAGPVLVRAGCVAADATKTCTRPLCLGSIIILWCVELRAALSKDTENAGRVALQIHGIKLEADHLAVLVAEWQLRSGSSEKDIDEKRLQACMVHYTYSVLPAIMGRC